jgi:hypothetical protein
MGSIWTLDSRLRLHDGSNGPCGCNTSLSTRSAKLPGQGRRQADLVCQRAGSHACHSFVGVSDGLVWTRIPCENRKKDEVGSAACDVQGRMRGSDKLREKNHIFRLTSRGGEDYVQDYHKHKDGRKARTGSSQGSSKRIAMLRPSRTGPGSAQGAQVPAKPGGYPCARSAEVITCDIPVLPWTRAAAECSPSPRRDTNE